jgi:hypothetical protein
MLDTLLLLQSSCHLDNRQNLEKQQSHMACLVKKLRFPLCGRLQK